MIKQGVIFKIIKKGEFNLLYYVIDAFTETRFGGNPADVVIYEDLNEEFMQKFVCQKQHLLKNRQ